MAIRGSGLISGLDTNSIIAQLVQLERAPIQRAQTQQREAEAEISALGRLSTDMGALSKQVEGLSDLASFLSYATTSSNESAFTATADGTATAGNYAIEVTSLARPEKNRSASFTDGFAAVAGTTLDIAVFGEDPVSIDITDGATLLEARDLINASGAEVSASIIDTGAGAYLSVTSTKEGFEVGGNPSDAVVLTETVTGAGGQALGLTELQAAVNAQFTVDGLPVESSSNTVPDIVSGITLELTGVTTTPETLSIASDPEGIEEKLKGFVDGYNDVLAALDRPELKGGSLDRLVRSDLQSLLSQAVPGLSTFVNLSSIGIESNSLSGRLSIDSTVLKDALARDQGAVAAVFTTDEVGVGASMAALLERYTDSSTGLIDASKDTLRSRVDRLDDDIEAKEFRLERFEASLVRQYTNLELVISQTQANFAGLTTF